MSVIESRLVSIDNVYSGAAFITGSALKCNSHWTATIQLNVVFHVFKFVSNNGQELIHKRWLKLHFIVGQYHPVLHKNSTTLTCVGVHVAKEALCVICIKMVLAQVNEICTVM